MMPEFALPVLLGTAVSLGVTHTLLGPDHYVPFVSIGRARGWSTRRALLITGLCGAGHVLSSVAIGTVGIAAGAALNRLVAIESVRGDWASWALIAFGCAYAAWGLWHGRHGHGHRHLPGGRHLEDREVHSVTFWTLVIVFVLGPCEPLIPLVMFPAAQRDWQAVLLVSLVFAVATIGTMTLAVLAGLRGLALVRWRRLDRFAHAMAGAIVASCGLAIRLFGI